VDLQWITGTYACCRLDPGAPTPSIKNKPCFTARTNDEFSIICCQSEIPTDARVEDGYVLFRVAGTLEFSLFGVLSNIAQTLADKQISILALSTFDTDYVLVKKVDQQRAQSALTDAGHHFINT
jgi:hypothetical protein